MSSGAVSWWRRWAEALAPLAVAACLGCSPEGLFANDEDRERNFQRARDAERLGDYDGAAEYYERAVERNPRSAAVHLGYASLCEGPLRRYSDAVHHYERYLRLRPDDPKAGDIRRRVTNCTERLAATVPVVVRSETIARELESVRRENLALRMSLTNLFLTANQWSNEWQRARAANAQSGAAGTNVSSAADTRVIPGASRPEQGGSPVLGSRSTHRVQQGETMKQIAGRYGVSLPALQKANPGIEPRRMRVGTILTIPAR